MQGRLNSSGRGWSPLPCDDAAESSTVQGKCAFQFDDPHLLSIFCGAFDQNLAFIEGKLDVDIRRHGNTLLIKVMGGKASLEEACQKFSQLLTLLYPKIQLDRDVFLHDFQLAFRQLTQSTGGVRTERELDETGEDFSLEHAARIITRRKTVLARSKRQDAYITAFERNDLTFGLGPAGTGKTFLAVAYAASLLEKESVRRIILSRPAVEAGERLGFLPGDMREKVDPYLRPLYDALFEMMSPERVQRAFESGVIEVAPLAFMRGRTLSDALIILDEAQNTTLMQMKMFLTRLGYGSKMIVTGDPSQIDLPPGQLSGLVHARKILQGVPGIGWVEFQASDVVRHDLVARIVAAYDAATKSTQKEKERGAMGDA